LEEQYAGSAPVNELSAFPSVSFPGGPDMGMSRSQEHLIRERNRQLDGPATEPLHRAKPSKRQSEMAVSQRGMNQESSQNKHNHPPKGASKH
jgi:hypothetical protein